MEGAVVQERRDEREHRATSLELFFDLVFVFAVTQVAGLIVARPDATGIAQGALVLAALWWTWAGYAWVANNAVDPDDERTRIVLLCAMAVLLVLGMSVPEAFGDAALAFGLAYVGVRVAQVALYAYGLRAQPEHRRAILRLGPTFIAGPLLVLAAAATDGEPQMALWIMALVIDIGSPLVVGVGGFRIDPGHFAERFGLFIIIALGESIVAVGVGASITDLDAAGFAAVGAAFAGIAALWWAYFDFVAIAAEHRLRAASDERAALARDAYSYLHYPMVAGIVAYAVGCKKTIEHAGDELSTAGLVLLAGGVALYLAGHVGFRLRMTRTWSVPRSLAVLAACAVGLAGVVLPALAVLALLVCVVVGAILAERSTARAVRQRLLHA